MSHHSWHDPHESLSSDARDLQRALTSLLEEHAAIDGYEHRVDAQRDEGSNAAPLSDAGEGIEHPMLTLDWYLYPPTEQPQD